MGVILQAAVYSPNIDYRLVGIHLYVVGKISVTGNSRSRTLYVQAGRTGAGNLRYQTARQFTLVRTRTGCLGVTIQFFF